MADYVFTADKPGGKRMFEVSEATITASDAVITAAVPPAAPGDVVHTAGYGKMKQMDLDGSWVSIE